MYILLLNILAQAPAAPVSPDSAAPQTMTPIIYFVAIMIFMWVIMIRPQQKRQKELTQRIASLKTGDRVVTTGGVHGTVSNVKDGPTLTLKVDDNCKLTVDKISIVTVLEKKD